MTAFLIFLFLLILQRLFELVLARRNERILKSIGAIEFDKDGYKVIVAMHVLFLISLVTEKVLFERELNELWFLFAILFLCAQVLRYWTISSLGVYWNTKVLVAPDHNIVSSGPYKYLRHPNYIAVIIEIATIPLIFSCYITAVVFSVINLLLLRRRIRIEEEALNRVS
ncbi:MAG TPA: isoprenylcysteine carboxylmethyltransferase family protein [Thermodesulfobacteriota bacterium]|nr:isoprenylcysteine carboxylmethyltransferase family protein [Thermodesulfobacteriota bacterium]